jgi:hypothetical protein
MTVTPREVSSGVSSRGVIGVTHCFHSFLFTRMTAMTDDGTFPYI